MKAEIVCLNPECRSVVNDAYGQGKDYRHVMLVESRTNSNHCPACGVSDVSTVRPVTDEHRFALGNVVTTPGVLELVGEDSDAAITALIKRHVRCDWGDVDNEDKRTNNLSLGNEARPDERARLLSAYKVNDEKVWVITEAGRHATTVLLPSEY